MGKARWWVCDDCTSLNDLPANKCYNCRVPKPGDPKLIDDNYSQVGGGQKRVGITVDLAKIGALTFEAPDDARYPALALAQRVMQTGGLSGAVFNAAKERALDAFIAGDIGFLDMSRVVEATLDKMSSSDGLQNAQITLDNVMETDRLARIRAGEAISQLG